MQLMLNTRTLLYVDFEDRVEIANAHKWKMSLHDYVEVILLL